MFINLLSLTVCTGDCIDMWSDCNCIDVDGVDFHRLVIVSWLAARSILSLRRTQFTHSIAVQCAK